MPSLRATCSVKFLSRFLSFGGPEVLVEWVVSIMTEIQIAKESVYKRERCTERLRGVLKITTVRIDATRSPKFPPYIPLVP
jgi:hypothetical protein